MWLPVPYHLTALSIFGYPGEFAFVPRDETVTSRTEGSVANVTSYLANYITATPTAAAARERDAPRRRDIVAEFGKVPAGVPAVVGDVRPPDHRRADERLRPGPRAAELLPRPGQLPLRPERRVRRRLPRHVVFLQRRRGYCQHFAATMAMMAREIGIPSRVVVGFLDPSKVQGGNQFVFTTQRRPRLAGALLRRRRLGQVRADPGQRRRDPPYTQPRSTVPPIHADQEPADEHGDRTCRRRPRPPTTGPTTTAPAEPASQSTGSGSGGGAPPIPWLVVVVVIALALTPGSIRWGIRRSRLARAVDGGESSEYAWLELRDRILDLRLPWTGSLTPRARSRFVEPLLGGDPDGVAALDRLSLTVERARYASSPVPGAQPARGRSPDHGGDRPRRRPEAPAAGVPLAVLADARAARHLGRAARQAAQPAEVTQP